MDLVTLGTVGLSVGAGGGAFYPIGKGAAQLVMRALTPTADEVGLYLAGPLRRRRERIERLLTRAGELATSPTAALPEGFLLRALDAAKDVEDDELRERWARLIASAADEPEYQQPMFVTAMAGLTPGAAKALEQFASEHRDGVHFFPEYDDTAPIGKIMAAETLRMLGFYEPSCRFCGDAQEPADMRREMDAIVDSRIGDGYLRADCNRPRLMEYRLSPFGRAFLRAIEGAPHPGH